MQKLALFQSKTLNFCADLQNKHKKKLKFFIHPTIFVLLFASFFVGLFWLFFIYFASVVYHEFAHAIVAKKLGYKQEKIVLYPTGALLYGATDEFTFNDEILISMAGPMANIAVIVCFVFFWWLVPELYNFSQDIVVANLSLALFNLLPVFPLDGGRVLLAILSTKLERKSACKIARAVAIIFSVILFLIFLVSMFYSPNFQFGIMSLVLFISSISEDRELAIKRVAKTDIKRRRLLHGLKQVTLVFGLSSTLKCIYDKIDNFAIYKIKIFDDNLKEVACFNECDIEKFCAEHALLTPIKIIVASNK